MSISFNDDCLGECSCNDNMSQIFCYMTPLTSNITIASPIFDQLIYSKSNRSFSSIYFYSYAYLPENAFKQITYKNNLDSNRIYYQITSSTRISKNLFGKIDEKLDVDITFITPLNPIFDDYIFNETKIKTLYFMDIKTTNSTPFDFDLNSFAGVNKIETLKFYRCSTLKKFVNKKEIEYEKKIVIENFNFIEFIWESLLNSTFDLRMISHSNIKTIQITGSQIKSIDNNIFYYMDNLNQLDLSGNNLSRIDEATFNQRNSSIEKINLYGNPIEFISLLAFKTQKNLKSLSLVFSKIKQISFNIPPLIEKLELVGIKTLESFDWQLFVSNLKLKTLSLSFLSNKNLIFNPAIDDSLALNTMLNRIELLQLNGYNFTDTDICKFSSKSLLLNEKPISLFQLDYAHPCNCFTIEIYRLYKILTKNQTNQWLTQTPNCYRRINNSEVLLDLENQCLKNNQIICQKPTNITITSTISQSIIKPVLEGSKNLNSDLTLIIALCIIGVVVIVTIFSIVIIYKVRTSYKLKKEMYQTVNNSNYGMDRF